MTTAGSPSRSKLARGAHSLADRNFERILLIKPSSLGDVIHALPVLRGMRRKYPRARIDWLISSSLAPLLEDHPDISELIRFDRRRFGRMATSPRIAGEFLSFLRGLRRREYDLVVDLQGLFRTGLLAAATGAPVRIGFRAAREGAWLFYTDRLAPRDSDTHAVDRNYLVAEMLGFDDSPIEFPLHLTDADRAEARHLLNQWDVAGGSNLLAVAPAARWETKVWPPERFAEAMRAIQHQDDAQVVLLGGPAESEICRRIASLCTPPPLNLAGRTNLRTLAAIIERADTTLCLDSGVMHLAVALDRPLVCLVGPTNPRRTGPYNRPLDVLRLDLDCAPCYFRRLSQCPYEHRCMRDLPVQLVADAVLARLRSARTPRELGNPDVTHWPASRGVWYD